MSLHLDRQSKAVSVQERTITGASLQFDPLAREQVTPDPKPVSVKKPAKRLKRTASTKRGSRSGVTKLCAAKGCTNEFYVYPSWEPKRFCSRACWYATKRGTKSNISDTARKELQRKMRRRFGKKNPNFKNGNYTNQKTFKMPREVSRVFNLGLKGETCCRVCGSTQNLNAHHAIPRSVGTRESTRDLRNLLPLCSGCHSGWHRGHRFITQEMFTAEEWAYLCSVKLTGRETLPWLEEHYPPEAEAEPTYEEKIRRAVWLRSEGRLFSEIGIELGVAACTASAWLRTETAERFAADLGLKLPREEAA